MANAGWYNDEHDPALARWYDGAGWTDHVVDKAAWEAVGQPPPPPEAVTAVAAPWAPPQAVAGSGWADEQWDDEQWDDEGSAPARPRRGALVAASALGVAVLLAGGIALAAGGDDPSSGSSTDRDAPAAGADDDRPTDLGAGLGDPSDTVVDATVDAAGDGTGATGAAGPAGTSGTAGSTGSRAGTAGTTRTTARGGSTVQRTESRSNSSTGPQSVSEVRNGDETRIGNTTNTSISSTYTPPPEPPPEEPTPEEPPAEEPVPETETPTDG